MQILTTSGPTKIAYLDGVEFDGNLAGVLFAIEVSPDGALTCSGVHAECQDHMIQYDAAEQASFFARALATASNDNPPLYDASGAEAWTA